MRAAALIGCLLVALSGRSQAVVLPLQRDGKWQIVDTNGRVLATTDFSYIYPFDNAGYSRAVTPSGFQIIRSSGQPVLAEYFPALESLGGGQFSCKTATGLRLIDARQGTQQLQDVEGAEAFAKNWIVIREDSIDYAVNLVSNRRLKEPFVSQVREWGLVTTFGDTSKLFDERGQLLLSDVGYGFFFHGRFYIPTSDSVLILLPVADGYSISRVKGTISVEYSADGEYFSLAGSTSFYSDNKLIWTLPYESVFLLDDRFLVGRKKSSAVLLDRHSCKILASGYDNYYPVANGIEVSRGIFSGLLDTSYREVIPCKYESFSLVGPGLYKTSVNQLSGLYSAKLKKDIIPPVYTDIEGENGSYTAYRGTTATIFNLNENHVMTDRVVLDNVRRVKAYTGLSKQLDRRLFANGWFTDTNLVDQSRATFYSVRWGLKNGDQVLIRPSFGTVEYLTGSPYAQVFQGEGAYRMQRCNMHQLYGNSDGKTYTSDDVVYVQDEYAARHYHRIETTRGYAVLDSAGKYTEMSYVDFDPTNKYPRCAKGGTFLPDRMRRMEETSSLLLPEFAECVNVKPMSTDGNPLYNRAGVLKEAKWNYLQPGGVPLFPEDFDEACDFQKERAIVRLKKWGVISPDTVIIPLIYEAVQPVGSIYNQQFLVSKLAGKHLYFDHKRQPVSYEFVGRTNKKVFVLETGTEKMLVNADGRQIAADYSSYRFLKNGYIIAKSREGYALFSEDGDEVYSGKSEPDELYSGQVIRFTGKKDKYLLAHGDTLRGRTDVQQHGPYTIIRFEGKFLLYLAGGSRYVVPEGTYLSDGTSLVLYKDGKIRLFDGRGKFTGKVALAEPVLFANGRFVTAKGFPGIYDIQGKLTEALTAVESAELLSDGTVLVHIDKKLSYHYDRNWRKIMHGAPFKKLQPVGNDCYVIPGLQKMVSAPGLGKAVPVGDVIGTFVNDRLLVKESGGYFFLDENLVKVNAQPFLAAKPFLGQYAVVRDVFGWVIVDTALHPTSIPSRREISAAMPDIFTFPSPQEKGVLDREGKVVIPVIYEEVELLPCGYYQCLLNGENYYFRKDGSRLFE